MLLGIKIDVPVSTLKQRARRAHGGPFNTDYSAENHSE